MIYDQYNDTSICNANDSENGNDHSNVKCSANANDIRSGSDDNDKSKKN